MTDRDWTVAPGEILREWREERGLDLPTAAVLCFIEDERYERIEAGVEPIDLPVAVCLAMGTGIRLRFWMGIERQYRADLERLG